MDFGVRRPEVMKLYLELTYMKTFRDIPETILGDILLMVQKSQTTTWHG